MGACGSSRVGHGTSLENSTPSAPAPGVAIKNGAYILGEELGSGAFSIVLAAVQVETNREVAVKCVNKTSMSKDDIAALMSEVEILREVRHPCVLDLVDFVEDKKYYYMVTDKLQGGELFDRIVRREQYGERQARDLVKVLVDTIAYLHQHHVIHRDLKPENLLLADGEDDSNIKLADFGLATKVVEENGVHEPLTQACGSPGYVAPEIIAFEGYGKPVDVWAIGVIVYILLCGYPPFQGEDQDQLFENIKHGRFGFDPQDWNCVSHQAKSFICDILTVDVKRRPTARALLDHPWMTADVGDGELAPAIARLKKYNARRRLLSAMNTVRSIERMKLCLRPSKPTPEEEEKPKKEGESKEEESKEEPKEEEAKPKEEEPTNEEKSV